MPVSEYSYKFDELYAFRKVYATNEESKIERF